jgi:hypothetical protein
MAPGCLDLHEGGHEIAAPSRPSGGSPTGRAGRDSRRPFAGGRAASASTGCTDLATCRYGAECESRPASMSSVRLCAAGPAPATSPLLSARSTRWSLRISARHASGCQARGRRGSHEWMLHRCGACDDAARLGKPLARGRRRSQDMPRRRRQPMGRDAVGSLTPTAGAWRERRKLCSVAHGQIGLSERKSRVRDRLLHIIGRWT